MRSREIVSRLRDYRDELYLELLRDSSDLPLMRLVSTVLEDLDGILEGEF